MSRALPLKRFVLHTQRAIGALKMIQIPKFSRLLSENCYLQAALHILANIFLIAAFLLSSSCESKKKISPEDQSLRDKYNQIEEEMTEEQVYALLIGNKS